MNFNDLRFILQTRAARVIMPGYRFKWPQMNWLHDPWFNTFLARFGEMRSLDTERRWMIRQLVRLTESVPGDTAECGVFAGAGSYLICSMNAAGKQHRRHHHVFDSFEGLSRPGALDGKHWTKGDLARGEDVVRRNLSDFADAVTLYKGWIPERFGEVAAKRFSFVHVDVDLYEPTRDSLVFFYERLNPGGVLLCDDYGSTVCPGATRAADELLRDKPEKMVAMASGGGFLIKGLHTSAAGGIVPV